MMTPQKEKELAPQMRLIARQYCDGAFNKIEYRRRRRELLQQCVERDLEPVAATDEPVEELRQPAAVNVIRRDWMPYLMVGVTVVVLGVMGFLLISMI
ncbi:MULTISPECIES: hypothetical protein [unclassified Ketobacter]|uniref:hypothetical protein n=1 Tax=unclassified Ketobacter TaxID=2639109 RepID=UPI0025BE4EA1|nr:MULTISPECIES: hypothetical protein [unclassified Ketobacter]MCK5792269.1 hypothetical protein [Ketobacter sp.]MEC8809749.1 hypothetical protein [Pseudomonadota bacterium]